MTERARRAHRPAQATALDLGVERGARACGRRQFTYLRDALRVAGTRLPLSCRGTLLGAKMIDDIFEQVATSRLADFGHARVLLGKTAR